MNFLLAGKKFIYWEITYFESTQALYTHFLSILYNVSIEFKEITD